MKKLELEKLLSAANAGTAMSTRRSVEVLEMCLKNYPKENAKTVKAAIVSDLAPGHRYKN